LNYLDIILLILTLGYIVLILYFYTGWLKINKHFEKEETPASTKFSILISMRNEAHCVLENMTNLFQQNYPLHLFELVLINDHSTDNTLEIITDFKNLHPELPISVIDLSKESGVKNKKQAITKGIEHAKFDWIVLTDADCIREATWLQAVNRLLSHKKHLNFVYAPVVLQANNWFEKLQSLEFSGLLGIGAGSIQLSNPNMCSAANLIFRKSIFNQVEGYKGNEQIASGDDEFLMHKIHVKFPGTLAFLKDREAIVSTKSASNLNEFMEQRKRWVSKSTKYENKSITFILVAAYLFNLLLVFYLSYGIVELGFLKLGIFVLLMKTFLEGLFIFSVLKFLKLESYIWYLPIAAPFHLLYVIAIGFLANTKKYHWKDRTH